MKYSYEIKKEIVDVAHMLDEKGLVGTFEGNISAKEGNRVYLTPSGRSKKLLTEGQIITTDLNGNVIEGDLKPTSETPMHTLCYKLRDDIKGVVHCHAPYATAFAQAGKPIELKSSHEFPIMFGIVPLIPFGKPGTENIIKGIEDYIMDYDVFLLEGHGVLSVGKSVFEAYSKTVSLEMLLQTELLRKAVTDGKNSDLPKEDYEELLKFGLNVRGYHPDK